MHPSSRGGTRRIAATIAALCVALSVAGCAPAPQIVIQKDPVTRVGVPTLISTFRGYPAGVHHDPFSSLPNGFADTGTAVYADAVDSHRLNVSGLGSGSCPSIPVSFSITEDGELTITLDSNLRNEMFCTADLTVTTAFVEFPDEVKIPKWVTLLHRSRFDGDDGSPVRILVRPMVSPTDSQTRR